VIMMIMNISMYKLSCCKFSKLTRISLGDDGIRRSKDFDKFIYVEGCGSPVWLTRTEHVCSAL
jgi:hypothetical protein